MPRQTSYQKREKELNAISRTVLEKRLKKELPSEYVKDLTKGGIVRRFLIHEFGKDEDRKRFNKDRKEKVARTEKILEKKTVAKLKESATEFRIKGRSKMRKAELVKAVAREIAF